MLDGLHQSYLEFVLEEFKNKSAYILELNCQEPVEKHSFVYKRHLKDMGSGYKAMIE